MPTRPVRAGPNAIRRGADPSNSWSRSRSCTRSTSSSPQTPIVTPYSSPNSPSTPPVGGTGQGTRPTPKEAVVHQQQVGPRLGGEPYGRLAEIHGGCDARDLSAVRQLQPIERLRGVRDLSDSQVVIEILGHLA